MGNRKEKGSSSKDTLKGADDTIKQTIVETLEAPMLKGVSTAVFVDFKRKRSIYEKRVEERVMVLWRPS